MGGWRDQPRGAPQVDPDTRGRKTLEARAGTKVLALPYAYGQASQGVASSIRATPRDDLLYGKVMTNVVDIKF